MNRAAASIVLFVRVFARVLGLVLKVLSAVLVRGTLSLGLLVGLVHFIIADPVCADYVSDLVSESIPGTVRMQRIHASPLLREWSVVGVRAYTAQWQPVIQAERVEFLLQRQEFFSWLFGLISGDEGVGIHADKVRVINGHVDVDIRHPDRLPIRDAFVSRKADSDKSTDDSDPLWIDFSRVSLDGVNVAVQTGWSRISLENVVLQGSLDIRAKTTDVRAHKMRFDSGSIAFPMLPIIGELPIAVFDAADAQVTEDQVVLGAFSTRVGGVEVTGRGTLGLDERQDVNAKFRVDTTFGNPVLERLLPLRGDGLVSMVFEVEGALLEPQVEADIYAEESSFGDLQIKQVSGHILWGKDLAGEGHWRYGLPRFKLLTQYGSVRVSGLTGRLTTGDDLSVNGEGLFRFRRLAPMALLKSLGVISGEDGIPPFQVDGRMDLSFHGGGGVWKLVPLLDLNVALGGVREIGLKGNPNLEISDSGVRISSRDLELWDETMRVSLEGESVWPEGQLDLTVRGDVHKLRQVALPFAEIPLNGMMQNLELKLSGTLPVPAIQLRADLKGVRIEGVEQIRGAVDVELRTDGVVDVKRFEAKAGGFDLETTGELQLFQPGTWDLAPKMSLKLRNMSLSGDFADQDLLPDVSGEVRVWSRKLYVDLLDPFKSVKGRLNVEGQHLSYGRFRLRTLELAVEGKVNQLKVERLHAVLPGGAQVSVVGRIMDFRENVDLRVRLLDLNLTRALSMVGLSPSEIPLVGFLRADVSVQGALAAPQLRGTVTGMSLRYGQVKLGRVAVGLKPLETGGAELVGERLPPGFELEEPSVLNLSTTDRNLSLTVGFNGLDPLSLLGIELSEGLSRLKVALNGRSRIHVSFDGEESTEPLIRLWLPESGLSVQGEPLEEPLHNPTPIEAWFTEGDLWVPNLQLRYGDADLYGCGVFYADGFLEAAVRGVVPLEVLTLQRAVFSDAQGEAVLRGKDNAVLPAGLLVGCNSAMVNSTPPPATLQGTLNAALVDAELHLNGGEISLRGLTQEIVIPDGSGFQLVGNVVGGEGVLELATMGDKGFQVQFGDGALSLQGGLRTRNLEPESLDLTLRGVGVEAASPRTFRIMSSPNLRIVGDNLSSPEQRSLKAEGEVTISEGFYYRSFDAFARAVGNVFGRKMDAYSRPITETFPILKDLELELKVKSSAFQVASPFPFGKAELDLDVNASVRGTLGRPEVYDVVHVRPGSTIQYSIFEREFEIFEGTIEFRGDPSHPHIELAARTVTTYTEATDDSAISSRSEGMSIEREESVTITIRITGTYPELDIDFSSDRPEFDEADIQSLIFTGVPARRSGGSGDMLADSSVSLFAEDLTGLLSKLMLTPFLDSVSLGVNRLGGITAEFLTSLGRSLSVKTRVMQVGVDTRVDTGFRVQFSDRVSLEGKLKVLQEEQDQTRTYEAKLKYRIPLDE